MAFVASSHGGTCCYYFAHIFLRHDPKLAEDYGHCFSAWQAHWNGADAFTGSWPLIGMSCLAVLLSCCAMIKLGVWY